MFGGLVRKGDLWLPFGSTSLPLATVRAFVCALAKKVGLCEIPPLFELAYGLQGTASASILGSWAESVVLWWGR